MFLEKNVFQTIIASTPLVSIDLIVRDRDGRVLLGKRNNRPAQGYWFVPGGRIHKGESISQAFRRLVFAELGVEMDFSEARFNGLYDHFYSDSVFDASISTHYVVNAFEVVLSDDAYAFPVDQHHEYRWFSESELLLDDAVHQHSKWYFMPGKSYTTVAAGEVV